MMLRRIARPMLAAWFVTEGAAAVRGAPAHLEPARAGVDALAEPVGSRAMLVACGRRHGLVASVSRIVSFAPLDHEQRDAYTRLGEEPGTSSFGCGT